MSFFELRAKYFIDYDNIDVIDIIEKIYNNCSTYSHFFQILRTIDKNKDDPVEKQEKKVVLHADDKIIKNKRFPLSFILCQFISNWAERFVTDLGLRDFILSEWLLPLSDNYPDEEIKIVEITDKSLKPQYIKMQYGGLRNKLSSGNEHVITDSYF